MPYANWPYLGVFAWLIACSLGLPFPEDVPLLTGGFLCHRGLAGLAAMIPVALVGVLAGDFILFGLGRLFGQQVADHRVVRRLVNRRRLLMAERLFAQHGHKIIFAGRFLPGLRPMIFMASGVLKVSFWRFAAVNGLAACISVPMVVLLGKLFGHNIDQIQQDVRIATHAIAMTVLVVGLIVAGVYLYHRQRGIMASMGAGQEADAETPADPAPDTELLQFDLGSPAEEQDASTPDDPVGSRKPQAIRLSSAGDFTGQAEDAVA